ncbi:hypothetical protein D3C81_1724220 [compost metagenome]
MLGKNNFVGLIGLLTERQQDHAPGDGAQRSGAPVGRGELLGSFAQLGLRHVGIEVLDPGFKRRFF